jgi:hypothetical protein
MVKKLEQILALLHQHNTQFWISRGRS